MRGRRPLSTLHPGGAWVGVTALAYAAIAGAAITGPVAVAATPPPWVPCAGATTTAAAPAPGPDDPALGRFGSLAADPNLTIELPMVMPTDPGMEARPLLDVHRVPGGVLVTAKSAVGPGYLATVVDDGGSVRWTTCSDEQLWTVAAAPTGSTAVVVTSPADLTATVPERVRLISLLDGATTTELTTAIAAIAGSLRVAASTPGGLFFTPDWDTIVTPESRLARVDLVSGEVSARAFPPGAVGMEAGLVNLGVTPSGYLAAQLGGVAPVDAALVEGVWTSDVAAVEEVTGPIVRSEYDPDRPILRRVHPDGTTVWQRDDLTPWQGEGFSVGVADDVVMARVCPGGDPMTCETWSLTGLDAATGTTRWHLDDAGFAVAWGDGVALVGSAERTWMIDVRTGEPIDDVTWPPRTFTQECCGEGDFVTAHRLGGLMVAIDSPVVRVYAPRALAADPVTVTVS